MAAPGWHPDPFGRHDHRFWDGSRWTGQVADKGRTADDPVKPEDQAPPPGEGPPGSAAAGKGRRALLIGLGFVVAIVVAVAVGLLLRDDGGGKSPGDGAGDFALTVGGRSPTVHQIRVDAGDAFFIRVEGKDVRAVLGLDEDGYRRLRARHYVERTDDLAAASDAADFFTEVASDVDTGRAVQKLPGFSGAVVVPLETMRNGVTQVSLVAPVGGTYSLLLLSGGGTERVTVHVRVKANPSVSSDIDSAAYSDAREDPFYTDAFRSDISREFSDDASGSDAATGSDTDATGS